RAYMREMGVDARLLELWVKARPDEMYVLSEREARSLGVVNNGRRPPEWSIVKNPGGSRLQGRQVTADGTGRGRFPATRSRRSLTLPTKPPTKANASTHMDGIIGSRSTEAKRLR